MPILHLSQLIGVAAGLDGADLKFKRHVVLRRARRREALRLIGPEARALRSPSNAASLDD